MNARRSSNRYAYTNMGPESAITHSIPKTKFGHKTQQNYKSLNLKIVVQICIHIQTDYFLIFKIK